MIQQILCLKCIEPNAEDGISESLVSLSRDVCLFFLSFFFCFFTCVAYFVIGVPRNYIGDRGWSLSYLGFTAHSDDKFRMVWSCGRLAQLKGFDHFVFWKQQCYSSYAIPANVYKFDDILKEPDHSQREHNHAYFINGMSKLLWQKQLKIHFL